MNHSLIPHQAGALALLLITLTAGAATPPDGGVSGLQGLAQGQATIPIAIARPGVDSDAAIAPLLAAGPLSADAAVRIALLNNPGLQLSLASEGVNVSDAVAARNPAKRQASQDITVLSAQVRKAWTRAVAAAQIARHLAAAKESAEAGGELARRMARAGNWSKLQQAREQLLLADAAAQLARAQQTAFSEREKLIVAMGLWGAQTGFTLPERLPDLPTQPQELPDVESRVLQQRLDLQLANAQWAGQRAARREPGADALWDAMRDAARVRELAVKARSQAREAYNTYRSSYDLARHYQAEVLPLYQFVNDETLLRYNGMLASVFELLAEARAQAQAAGSAVEAQRDFWLADADLQTVLAGAPLEAASGAASGASAQRASGAAAH
ncbi:MULTISPECIES: RND transporter [unclassified Polaromonas]|uniref:RND transporter n=1 Tax=unclassified Polaromonas TaxID=2638319 RepID=UPI000F077ED4|nr:MULTISPECIES: RND transporter [unclassified Polaromonas]AYQ28838.1 RND transporter [Polaromonas sp. SP1]QGJ20046.1 RND transporter [Polaromonas sp. Pch-P]